MTSRLFPLADILSMTTGRLLSRRHMDGIYEIANHMTGDNFFTHQLPRAAEACGPALLDQHPQLRDVTPPEDIDAPDLMAWLADTERQHGDQLPVTPLPAGAWQHQNPIEELCDMVGAERVIVAPLPPKESQ
ncbi:DUF7736 domain-containing protein [Streptomyces spinosisporus]|uniref:DUF7736 domain-containing protein n=1 Tax=Streptomyces spinosisporus TaxID=2927582 RepID=A0ABS9XW92_9ACTN|nr:hypothetical protein [Streptomyces spinosisporus]MCI3246344.1 hypothetical protein [Streptomyces spinosisporus]